MPAANARGTLPPPPFSLDHATQSLTAGRAAKPPRRDQMRACEMLFAPGTIAAKKSGFRRWALALARLDTQTRTAGPASTGGWPELPLPAGVQRGETDTVGSAPGVFPDRWWSADTARLARLRRQRRASARHSGLQYRAWGWVGRKGFSQPLSRHRRCRGRAAP